MGTNGAPESSIDIASISERGRLFSGLETLSRSNPVQFRKNTANIAQQLVSTAQNATDPEFSNMLKSSAGSFEKASQSGVFSDLFSHEAPAGGHGFDLGSTSQIFSSALPQVSKDLGSSYAA